MKPCKKIHPLMENALYNILPPQDKIIFQAHLDACPLCAEEFQRLKSTLAIMDQRERPDMSQDFWENYYKRLEQKLDYSITPSSGSLYPIHTTKHHWLFYSLAAAAILILGIGLGLYLSWQEEKKGLEHSVSVTQGVSPAVAYHFENVQPVLIDYANYTPETHTPTNPSNHQGLITLDKTTIKKLLLENQLLKRVVARQKNFSTQELLDELEIILLELENSNGDQEATRRIVKDLIQEYDILFKMDIYNKKYKQNRSEKTTSL